MESAMRTMEMKRTMTYSTMPKVPAPAMVYGPDYAGVRNEQPRPVQPMMMRQSDEEMGLRGGGAGSVCCGVCTGLCCAELCDCCCCCCC